MSDKGFALIEVMILVAIILILLLAGFELTNIAAEEGAELEQTQVVQPKETDVFGDE